MLKKTWERLQLAENRLLRLPPPPGLSSSLSIFRRRRRAVLRSAQIKDEQVFVSLTRLRRAKNLTAATGRDALGPAHRRRSAGLFHTKRCGERRPANRADAQRSRPPRRRGLTGPAWPERWPNHSIGVDLPSPSKDEPPERWSPSTNAAQSRGRSGGPTGLDRSRAVLEAQSAFWDRAPAPTAGSPAVYPTNTIRRCRWPVAADGSGRRTSRAGRPANGCARLPAVGPSWAAVGL